VCVSILRPSGACDQVTCPRAPYGAKDAGGGRPPGFYLVLLVTSVFTEDILTVAGFT